MLGRLPHEHRETTVKTVVLAILAVALATPLVPALAADDSDDDAATKGDIDKLVTAIDELASDLRDLAGDVDELASTVANINTNVTNRGQVAIVASRANATGTQVYTAETYLMGSSIPGFPAGTIAADGRFTDRKLPAGVYLFEVSNPAYSDNMVCHGSISRRHGDGVGPRIRGVCPRVWVIFRHHQPRREERLDDGFGIFRSNGTAGFAVRHRFPPDWSFEDKPASQYTGAVKITRLE